jgi:hypothetical protein
MLNNTQINNTQDLMTQSLIALCQREGGFTAVARALGVAGNTVFQIISGTKLPSGKPRGVGALLRKRLDGVYPNWLLLTQMPEYQVERHLAGIRQMLLSIAPDQRAAAISSAVNAMITHLPMYTTPLLPAPTTPETPPPQSRKH